MDIQCLLPGMLKSKKGISIGALIPIVAIFIFSSPSQSGTPDSTTQDVLITKLNRVYLNLPEEDTSRIPVSLRLADLLAERARIESMSELDKGCSPCQAGRVDRDRALELYKGAVNKLEGVGKGRVLLQIGHLFELISQTSDARSYYERIHTEVSDPVIVSEANFSLAEMDFRLGRFAEAQKNYSLVVAEVKASQRGLAAYRRAWCLFNLGDLEGASKGLISLLRTPELLSRSGGAGTAAIDGQFQQEVAHDLATFLAKNLVTEDLVGELIRLSSEEHKTENVQYLAVELERLGKLPAAIEVWSSVYKLEATPEKRVEGYLRLAGLYLNLGQRAEAIGKYKEAVNGWRGLGTCNGTVCSELTRRLKAFLIDLNQQEKKAPSTELLALYREYNQIFPSDYEMLTWAGVVAEQRQDWTSALIFYQQASATCQKFTSAGQEAAGAQDRLTWQRKLESSLLSAISVAEKSNDAKVILTSYQDYIDQSQLKEKVDAVRYQKAHYLYEQNDLSSAMDELYKLGVDVAVNEMVRTNAVDLYLDILALRRDNELLEVRTKEFAKLFPKRSDEFARLGRQALFNQAALLVEGGNNFKKTNIPIGDMGKANDVQADLGVWAKAWATLDRVDLKGANKKERELYYRNRLLAAEKLHKFDEARRSADILLQMAEIDSKTHELALSRKAWLSELSLDFQGALRAREQLVKNSPPDSQQWIGLAVLAELAGSDPRPYYNRFLTGQSKGPQTAAALEQIFEFSKDTKEREAVLSKYRKQFRAHPKVYGKLAIKSLGLNADYKKAAQRFKDVPEIGGTVEGGILRRYLGLHEVQPVLSEIAKHPLQADNQRQLAASFKTRIKLLGKLETLAQSAIDLGDWTFQVVCLANLAAQYERFYNEIMGLPIPPNLSSEQEQEYLQLLSNQAAPYQTKGKDLSKKVAELWSAPGAITRLSEVFVSIASAERNLLTQELQLLSEVAPSDQKTQILEILNKTETLVKGPTLAQLEAARTKVRENPYDKPAIEALKSIEGQMGRKAMVAYLQSRIAQIDADRGGAEVGRSPASSADGGVNDAKL